MTFSSFEPWLVMAVVKAGFRLPIWSQGRRVRVGAGEEACPGLVAGPEAGRGWHAYYAMRMIVNRHRRFTYRLVDFFFSFVRSFVRPSVRSILHFVVFFFSIGDFFLSSILLFTSVTGDFLLSQLLYSSLQLLSHIGFFFSQDPFL